MEEFDLDLDLLDLEFERINQRRRQIAAMQHSIESRAKFFKWPSKTARFIGLLSRNFNRYGGVWAPGVAGIRLWDETLLPDQRWDEIREVIGQLVSVIDDEIGDNYAIGVTTDGDVILYTEGQVATYMWER